MRYVSLFSGMEAAHLAWAPLGWHCAAVAEIDPAACIVLHRRLNASRPKYMPDPGEAGITEAQAKVRRLAIAAVAHLPDYGTPGTLANLGDVSQVTDADIAALGHVDVVIGGSPCQDLSLAGKRRGLAGARSSLFHQQIRIFHAARLLCGARWLLWENVPGAFSSHKGRDFARVVGEMAGLDVAVPGEGWQGEGVVLGPHGLVEWSVLDAQWFGVAQRRRRVFALLDTGDWAGRPPVLLEPESLRGDSPPRRETREGSAGTLAGGARRRGGYSTDDVPLIQETTAAIDASYGQTYGCSGQDTNHGHSTLVAFGGNRTCGPLEVAAALLAQPGSGFKGDFDTETFLVQEVAHTLRGEGFDASCDGSGKGTPLVPVLAFDTTQITSPGNVSAPKVGDPCHPLTAAGHAPTIAFGCRDSDPTLDVRDDLSPTLRAMGNTTGHNNGGGQVAVAYGFQPRIARNGRGDTGDIAGALSAQSGETGKGDAAPCVATHMAVRRLTPRECERLQGAQDDWTLVAHKSGTLMADGPRYKMLGNSFAVPVIRWIGQQISFAQEYADG